MDSHLLRSFLAVARTGSFSRAASELGYTQSAVSQHIAALETDLHVTLLRRRPVTPTEAGARLLDHAATILLRLDAARADLRRLTATPAQHLALGVSPLAQVPRLAVAVAGLRQAMPRLDVAIHILPRHEVTHAVAIGTVDVGLVDGVAAPSDPLPLPDAGPLSIQVVTEHDVRAFFPRGHPLSTRPGVELKHLAEAQWIDAPQLAAPLAQMRASTNLDGFRASLSYHGSDLATLLQLVAAGNGIAVLPATAAHHASDVIGVPLATPRLVHRIETRHPTPGAAATPSLLNLLAAHRHQRVDQ